MTDTATAFAAHLAALARVPDPEDRSAARMLGAVALDWTQLALSTDPRFELDGATFWVSGQPVALPAPWRESLKTLEGALRAHGVGGVRLVGPVDRGTVLSLLRGARAIPASASREELQRWVAGHGGASLQLLPPRPSTARDPRASQVAVVRAWSAFAAAVETTPVGFERSDLVPAARALIERGEADPRALPVVLPFAGPRPQRRGACVATLALLLGLRLGLGRGPLTDLMLAAVDAATLSATDTTSLARAIERRVQGRLGRADARAIATMWGLRPDSNRPVHLYARIVALADDVDGLLRGPASQPDAARRMTPDEVMAKLEAQAGRRHDPALVQVLVGALGRWPVGTTVLLDSGEVAVVCRAPGTPEQVSRPVVRVVVDRAGALLVGSPPLDLSLPDRGRSRIVASVDPARIGVDVARAVLG